MINPFALFTRRVRGFRVIDIAAVAVILVTALATYAFKTSAGAEDADSASLEARIVAEQQRIRLLNAELAKLDDPSRIEDLSSRYLGMGAETAKQDITLADLPSLANRPEPAPPAVQATTAADPEAVPTRIDDASAAGPVPAAKPASAPSAKPAAVKPNPAARPVVRRAG
ncbi:MAG: hypothetical protein KGL69_12305 [Alphaproteobacteria bacterium]|nr:hypothetical protein [Alphaproteobacteria bacterium]